MEPQTNGKYRGGFFDDDEAFGDETAYDVKKVEAKLSAQSRLMPNI